MPRLPRIRVDGAIYYVISRAIQNEVIFKDKEDYKMYLDLVTRYKSQHKFKLYSYCLLPDHLELLVETGDDASISEIMHDLNSLYTKYFNGRYQKHGHLFEDRFRSVLVEKVQHLLEMTRHIHRAPSDPANYPYSSFSIYKASGPTESQPDLKAESAEVLQFLKNVNDPAAYEKYVLEGDTAEIRGLEKRLRRGGILGSEEFTQSVKEKAEQHTQQLKDASKPQAPNRTLLFFIGGFVILATATSVYLYVSKQSVENRYEKLLSEKETEFAEKTKFENISPIALTELDGTSWRLDLIALPADKAKAAIPDTVHFADGYFWSEQWSKQGFKPGRYTLLVRPGGLTTWEVLLKSASGDVLSWRGDWQGDAMKGVVRHAPAGKNPQPATNASAGKVFSFFSAGWSYAEAQDDAA